MPKVSEEHKEERKKEIIDACEMIYREQGFCGVNIKEISTRISCTRPSVYTYFETKDEILLALLCREYDIWCDRLKAIPAQAGSMTRKEVAEAVAHTLDGREVLLRIQCMNLFEIEVNSRVERLAEFKLRFRRMYELFTVVLQAFQPEITTEACDIFCRTFSSFLFGVYPFVFHTENQIKAMEIAEVQFPSTTVYQMVYDCLMKILP